LIHIEVDLRLVTSKLKTEGSFDGTDYQLKQTIAPTFWAW
jgi:hypothetical protein